MMPNYCGIYAGLIEQYIDFKRNLGYKFVDATYTLSLFDRFTIDNAVLKLGLSKEIVDKWSEKRPNESDKTRYARIHYIAKFSAYLNDMGYPSHIPRLPKKYSSTFVPHIFSKKEVNAFFDACDTLKVNRRFETTVYVLPALFRMLYGCGIRISEALSLTCKDVDLDAKNIIVRETKNGKDRILPLSETLTEVCIQYRNVRPGKYEPKGYFFIKNNGQKCNAKAIYEWFRKILWNAGIPHGGKGFGPRMHDFRHTFSVHSLVKMSEAGLDLYYSLPILSKYLGHQSLEATDKYVRLTSDMYPDLIREVDNVCAYVFPEVDHYEAD
ncbi:tyrosine-type recombinase/integrase [Bacillaceae bacterium IKA-2]|nr:tyrosine-type recombinase/integrase [Bacillaceae bacterium IKA-2]WNF35233.1 tyrosine-type recombinase/integrase [Bacillaceae bacterium IKA-2]WNF35295.1 tyrosine-type recombinase/integrase [Bacillaceae bacterium IKA-2]WNF35679.1 tyrosine-type recombinase/integrase [Bacillaceae bacterium IKA-2]WNF35892.1 tyrosine-type recombinase/integrase [Bacillaceae bacterium IKA-2]